MVTLPHPFNNRPLLPAVFVARPNRFIGEFHFPGNTTIHRAHIADPGRLIELMIPGATVWVVDYTDHQTRKLPYAMPYVQSQDGEMVSIYSRLPNIVAKQAVEQHAITALKHYTFKRNEPTVIDPNTGDKSRLDMALTNPQGATVLVEVKGASLVENSICKFPDAPTVRGARQINTLARLQATGQECHLIIICQRSDATAFRPHHERDPDFARAFAACQAAGVGIHVLTIRLTPQHIELGTLIPVMGNYSL